jgi:predicted PurR-regulated permease PerM
MDRINWQRMRDILMSIICGGIIFWALWTVLGQFVESITVLLLAMAVAFLMTPVVNLLVRWGLPRLFAAVVAYVLILAALSGLAYELIVSLTQQVDFFSTTIIDIANTLPTTYAKTIDFLNHQIGRGTVLQTVTQIQAQAYGFAQLLAGNAFSLATNALSVFLNILLVTVLSFYFTLDGKRIRDSIVGVAPKGWQPNVLLFEDALSGVVGKYIRGQLMLAFIVGVATGLICLVTNLGDYALICGVVAFLCETIPMLGPALASITPILLSLLLGGDDMFQRTLFVVVLFILLQVIESNILGPRIVGQAVGLHPVAAILALLIGAKLFGVFGALIATPIVAAIWVVIASIYRSTHGETVNRVPARKPVLPWQDHGTKAQPGLVRRERSRNVLRSRTHIEDYSYERCVDESANDDVISPITEKSEIVHNAANN